MTNPTSIDPDATDPPNPWVTHTTEVRYDNPWVRVTHRTVTTPTGTAGIYGHVHYKNLGVGIIPIDDQDHTWLVGQYRYAVDEYTWEIPEGGCPVGTDPAETARRELQEECGLLAAKVDLLVECQLSNSVTDELGLVYVGTDLTAVDAAPDDTEDLTLRRLPVAQAISMALRGEITDSLSLLGLLRLGLRRQSAS